MSLRGWKVRDGLTWTDEIQSKGLTIATIWKDNCMVKHNDNKFVPGELVRLGETTRLRLLRLYNWMASRTPAARGGRLVAPCSAIELRHALYIWRAFRTQAWQSWRLGLNRLTFRDLIPELRTLCEELEVGRVPGGIAMKKALPSVLTGEPVDVGHRDPARGMAELNSATRRANLFEPLALDYITPHLADAVLELHALLATVYPENHAHRLSPAVWPQVGRQFEIRSRPRFQPVTIASLERVITQFARARGSVEVNPMDGFIVWEVAAEQDLIPHTAKRKIPDQSKPSFVRSGISSKKRRSNDHTLVKPVLLNNNTVQALGDQCGNVWDATLVLQGAFFLDGPESEQLQAIALDALYPAAEFVATHRKSAHPIFRPILATIQDIDSFLGR